MRRHVSGHRAPNTASSATVQMSKISVRSTSSRQPSWSNSNALPASLTTISITGPSLPKPVSLSRQPQAVSASSYSHPYNHASSCGVSSGARWGAAQRTSLRSVGSSRKTWPRVPSMLTRRSLSGSVWPQAEQGAALAEHERQAFSGTKNASYSGHINQSLDNMGAHRTGSFQCSQTASFSHALQFPSTADRGSPELTTVLSSVDIAVKHVVQPAASSSAAVGYSQFCQPAKLTNIDMQPLTIQPPQFEPAFSSASLSSMVDKDKTHRSTQTQHGQAFTESRQALSPSVQTAQPTLYGSFFSPGPFSLHRSGSDPSTSKSHMQSPTEVNQMKSDGAPVTPSGTVESRQTPTEGSKKTEHASQPAAHESPLSSIEFSQTRPIPEDFLTPLKSLEYVPSPAKQLEFSSPPKPLEHLLNQPASSGLLSPLKPIDFLAGHPQSRGVFSPSPAKPIDITPPRSMAVDMSGAAGPLWSLKHQPMTLDLASPLKPIEFAPSSPTAANLSSPPGHNGSSKNQPMSLHLTSPPKPIEFTSSSPTAANLASPPGHTGSPKDQPMNLGLASPPKPIEFTPSSPAAANLSSSPGHTGSPKDQPMTLGLVSPPKPIEFTQSLPTTAELSSPPGAIGSWNAQPMTLGLASPPKPIEFTQSPPTGKLSTPPGAIGLSNGQRTTLGVSSPPKAIEFNPTPPTETNLSSPPRAITSFKEDQPKTPSLASPPKPIEFAPSSPQAASLRSEFDSIGSSMQPSMTLGLASPPKPIEFATSQPMTVGLTSPPRSVGSLMEKPLAFGSVSPLKPIEFSPLQPVNAGLSSHLGPIGSPAHQRLSLGFHSPPGPTELVSSLPVIVNVSTPPTPSALPGARPMSLQLVSPPKAIQLFNTEVLSLKVEAKPSQVAESASPSRPVDAPNTDPKLQLVSPPTPELSPPRVEIGAFTPPADAHNSPATVVQVNSSVPLQLELLLTPPQAIELQPDERSPPEKEQLDTTAAKSSSGPLSPVSAVLSPQFSTTSPQDSQAADQTSSVQLVESMNKEEADKNQAKRPSAFLFTPPTPVIKAQVRRPTMSDVQMGRRPSTKKL